MRDKDPFSELIRSIEENLQGGNWEPVDETQEPPPPGNPRRLLWIFLPFLLLIFFNRFIHFYTDLIWYQSLNLDSVFYTRIYASFGIFLLSAILFWIFLATNVFIARRIEPFGLANTPIEQIARLFGINITPIVLGIGAILALLIGLNISSIWEDLLIYLYQQNLGLNDPIFHRDASFFMFTLPIWQLARNWLLTTTIITLLATALVSGVGWRGWDVQRGVLIHLGALGSFVLLLVAWRYRLNAYQLVYSARGAVFGGGYTDLHAQLPAYNILTVVTLAAAVLLVVVTVLRSGWRAMLGVLAVWFAVSFLAGSVYPGLVQRFQVDPNELNLERPYIENNIEFTRAGFDLDTIESRNYDVTQQLTADDLLSEPETVTNIRLWDYRPLLQTYNQVQALRQYYHFNDIDIDRYMINGELRQVMLGARELVPDQLNENAQTWVNRKLVYTHGYGVATSPVAQVTRDGLPEFLVKDLPPRGDIEVTQPQIYFGELTNDYVIVNTSEPEFDYPRGDGNVTTSFEGSTGIRMNLLNRLLFALRFADINMLLNSDIGADSQLLWYRNIRERVQELAPFLHYDSDPYMVIDESGKLYWMLDAYTVSYRFPYSEPFTSSEQFVKLRPMLGANYVRNPIKVVINAYDGQVHFYLLNADEPVAAAYARIFPALFTAGAEMPADLKAHIRYPNDFFSVQAEVYRTYHMTNPTDFYNKEDVWAWPMELFEDKSQPMEPYYVLMQLPDNDELDFIQILPFTPAGRENMLAWLAAHNDPDKYGQKIVYKFGKDSLVYGPQQIEARIDQDPDISALFSLWNQPDQGSSVLRGNLLVIPFGESLLYVEPLYLQAETGKIPELKRVILATSNRVEMAENLGLALAKLFGRNILSDSRLASLNSAGLEALNTSADTPAGDNNLSLDANATVEELIVEANTRYANAQEFLRNGDWSGYGREMATLQQLLSQLADVVGADVEPPTAPDTNAPAEATPTAENATESSD